MTLYRVRFLNKDEKLDTTIECSSNKSILESAEDLNIDLPFSCRAGACSSCVGKLIKGKVNQLDQTFLDEEQITEGFILTCVAYPESDCTLLSNEELNLY